MASLLIKNGLILTLDDQNTIYQHGDVYIVADRIQEIGSNLLADETIQVIDATGELIMPGLNIAHAHSWGNLFKGLFDGKPLDIWILENNAPPDGSAFQRPSILPAHHAWRCRYDPKRGNHSLG